MAHHHNHDTGHHHHHESHHPLTFDEKIKKRLEHWVKHNDDHEKAYREWAEKAKENDMEKAGFLLDDVADMTRLITGKFKEALESVKNR